MSRSSSARNLLIFTSAAVFLLGIENGGFQLVITQIAAEYRLSATTMGMLVTAQYAAMLITPLLMGRIADRHGKKKLLLFFLPILILSSFTVAISYSLSVFFVGIFGLGAGYSICESMSTAALSDADPIYAERNITLTQAFYSLGAMVSPIIVNILLEHGVNWRAAFVMVMLGFLLLIPMLCNTRFASDENRGPEKENVGESSLLCRAFLALVIATGIYAVLETGLTYFIDSFFQNVLRSDAFGAYGLAAFWLAQVISKLSFGLHKTETVRMAGILFFLSAGVNVGLAASRSPWSAVLLCFLCGAALGPIWPMLIGIGTRSFREQSGIAAGILMAFSGLGGALAPTLMGLIADRMDVGISVLMLATAALVGGGICLKGLCSLRNTEVNK